MKEILKISIPLLLVVAALAFFIYRQIDPAPEKKITIATGRSTGMYYQYAQEYKSLLEEEGITVDIRETAGSVETLELLRAHKVDIGFVQGGTSSSEDSKGLKSICSIYFEPVWLFYRASMGDKQYLNEFGDIKLSVGEKGSGTMMLSQKIMAQTDVSIDSDYIQYLSTKDSYEAFKLGEIDAFFAVLSPDSKLIKTILLDDTISHANLKRIPAFAKSFIFLNSYKIYEGSINLKENIPNQDINLLTTTATLVTHSGVDDMLVRLISIKAKKHADNYSEFPSIKYLEIPIHEASEKYLEKGDSFLEKLFPYWIASKVNRLKYMLIPLLTLFLPLFKGFFPLYRWRWRSKIYRWYSHVDDISKEWESLDRDGLVNVLAQLDNLMLEIKFSTDVPLTFKGEYYTLELHIDNVMERISKMIDK